MVQNNESEYFNNSWKNFTRCPIALKTLVMMCHIQKSLGILSMHVHCQQLC